MEYECVVLSFLYLERVLRQSDSLCVLDASNWRGLVLACMIMANKVWDDFHMRNVDYMTIFPSLTLRRINELELQLLHVLNANLSVGVGEYASYHFRVQAQFARAEIAKVAELHRTTRRASVHQRKIPTNLGRIFCDTSNAECSSARPVGSYSSIHRQASSLDDKQMVTDKDSQGDELPPDQHVVVIGGCLPTLRLLLARICGGASDTEMSRQRVGALASSHYVSE